MPIPKPPPSYRQGRTGRYKTSKRGRVTPSPYADEHTSIGHPPLRKSLLHLLPLIHSHQQMLLQMPIYRCDTSPFEISAPPSPSPSPTRSHHTPLCPPLKTSFVLSGSGLVVIFSFISSSLTEGTRARGNTRSLLISIPAYSNSTRLLARWCAPHSLQHVPFPFPLPFFRPHRPSPPPSALTPVIATPALV